jgi:glucan 1,3-beta-glucosidase
MATIIMATGSNFQDITNPRPVVKVGNPGQLGLIEWSDTFISTRGPCAGATLIQYNLFSADEPSGMWDIHTRIGGFPGTDLQLSQCPALMGEDSANPNCVAAFMSMHITAEAGGLFTENCWLWVADHDLEDDQYQRISIYAGRGLLIESQKGRIWLSATGSEHHVLYQYQLVNTHDIYLGHLQTESPYFQPRPPARHPFPPVASLHDPIFEVDCAASSTEPCESSWGMRVLNSRDVIVHGAGLYSFFNNYDHTCSRANSTRHCQERVLTVQNSSENVKFLGLSTVGVRIMIVQDGVDLVPASPNNSTFADTLALYYP